MSLYVTLKLQIKSKRALINALNRADCSARIDLDRTVDRGDSVLIYLKNFVGPLTVTIGKEIRYDEDNFQSRFTGQSIQAERWGRLEDLCMFYTAEAAKEDAAAKELSFEEVWEGNDLFVETSHAGFEGTN